MDDDFEAPYWGKDVDVDALWKQHAIEGAEVADFAETFFFEIDPNAEFGIPGPLAIMQGTYAGVPFPYAERDLLIRELPANESDWSYGQRTRVMALHPNRTSPWIFTPGEGEFTALVVPIVEGGELIDLLAFTDEYLWGTVTGRALSVGPVSTIGQCRVYKTPWQWFLHGCDGVLPLATEAFASLGKIENGKPAKGQPILLAESLEHAEELIIRVFGDQAFDNARGLKGQPELMASFADQVEAAALAYVGVDDERYDMDAEIERRVKAAAEKKLVNEGILTDGSFTKRSNAPSF